MSKDVKVLVLVFASLAGLVVLAFGGVVAFFALSTSHQVSGSNAKNNAAAATKIANFSLPPGYRYEMSMDMFVMNMVMIGSNAHPHFMISLQGMSVNQGASDEQLGAGMQQGLFTSCVSKSLAGHEQLKTASGKTVSLDVLDCRSAIGTEKTIELSRIPSKYPLGMIVATGTPRDFDRSALDALVRSIR